MVKWLGILGTALVVAGCNRAGGATATASGDAGRGRHYIEGFGCGSCHVVPGVRRADGVIGPPLTAFGRRAFVAGEVPNTPENLEHWLENPQSIEPGTAMPNLGISGPVARDMAAYLLNLR